jgi:hypothetical protein
LMLRNINTWKLNGYLETSIFQEKYPKTLGNEKSH